jgi:hypothetical protein
VAGKVSKDPWEDLFDKKEKEATAGFRAARSQSERDRHTSDLETIQVLRTQYRTGAFPRRRRRDEDEE